MTIDPMPPLVYVRFAQTMSIFKEYLSGATKADLAAKHSISMDTLENSCVRFGNYAYRCWEQAGMPEPKCIPRYYDKDGRARHYFDTLGKVRREKKFWLAQLERMALLYDAQLGENERSQGQVSIAELGLGTATMARLQSDGVYTIAALKRLTVKEFKTMVGIGQSRQREIREALRKYLGTPIPYHKDVAQMQKTAGFIGTLPSGALDLIGEGDARTIQLDGSFTRAQLERLIGYMKTQE